LGVDIKSLYLEGETNSSFAETLCLYYLLRSGVAAVKCDRHETRGAK